MRQAQVVAQRLGPLVGALVVGAGEQVLHELAADPQLGVGHPAQPGQLDGEHGGAVLDRHHVGGTRAAVRVHQREQAEHPGPRRGQGDHAITVADRAARGHQAAEQLLPVVGGRLRVRGGLAGARPRGQVAVPVLDRYGQPGQVVQGFGDAGRTFPGGRDPGEALVDLHAPAQRGHGLLQRRVGLGQLRSDRALPRVQLRVGHRHPGLLRHHLGQELVLAGGLAPAQAIMCPIGPAMLRIGYAQAQPPSSGAITLPPVSGRLCSCSLSCGGMELAPCASVRQASPTANPAIRHAPSDDAADTASRRICSSSALSVIRMDSTSSARRLVSWPRSEPSSSL